MEIRVLGKEDAKQYRELRLEGLKGVPEAFSSSFDEESKMDVAAFASRFGAAHVFTFGAFIEQKLAGTVTLICETKTKLSIAVILSRCMFQMSFANKVWEKC